MKVILNALFSSIGRKFVMAITGLGLVGFLLGHLAGNFLLFLDDNGASFNKYAHFMSTSPIIRIIEIILVLGFLFHIIDGITLKLKEKKARPQRYKKYRTDQTSSFYSRMMGTTGMLILIFLLIHLNTFFAPHRFGYAERTMYHSVVHSFQYDWWGFYWLYYVLMMILLGFHLNHGFQSAFKSLGLNHTTWNPVVKITGSFLSIFIAAGFASMPIYFYLQT